ncbi:hypothetical protein SNE40_020595 [Patella caerulea]|uniref:Fibrinogen C-terminal domain-containing protein n=1 Tax=Patella caerulea TaxID=87958 RepID=A0AAN8J4R0_PATCE
MFRYWNVISCVRPLVIVDEFCMIKTPNYVHCMMRVKNCLTDEEVTDKVCYRLLSVCDELNCERCPIGYYGDTCQHVIEDCTDGKQKNVVPMKSTASFIRPSNSLQVVEVFCDFNSGGWTFILSREGRCREINFNRTWSEYGNGFGYRSANHWLGLENIHSILDNHPSFTLQLYLSYDNPASFALSYYRGFYVHNVTDNYKISIASFLDHSNFPAGDSLTNGSYNINDRPFSTYDRDYSNNNNCPGRFGGGWWYLDDPVCSRSNLNGRKSGDNFESTSHWLDNLGNRTDFNSIHLKLNRN